MTFIRDHRSVHDSSVLGFIIQHIVSFKFQLLAGGLLLTDNCGLINETLPRGFSSPACQCVVCLFFLQACFCLLIPF